MNEKLEKLNQEIEKTEKKLRRAQHEEKILEHQIKTLTRKERTHRLCTRAAMLESYLPHPEAITDEQVSLFLKLLFRQDVSLWKKCSPVTAIFRERTQAGNGHNCFQSRSPWAAPLKEGATIHHLKVVCCALPGASCGKRMIARSGSYTSPALATASYPFVDLPPGNTLRRKLFPSSKFYNRPLYFSETMRYNEVNDKLEFI